MWRVGVSRESQSVVCPSLWTIRTGNDITNTVDLEHRRSRKGRWQAGRAPAVDLEARKQGEEEGN